MERLKAISMFVGAVSLAVIALGQLGASLPAAKATTPAIGQKCEWRYIKDGGSPEIPDYESGSMDKEWQAMASGGYRLVGVHSASREGASIYVFERCR